MSAMQVEHAVGTSIPSSTDALRLRALADVQRLLHARNADEADLLEQVCEILARDRPYPGLWMAAAEPDGTLRPLAQTRSSRLRGFAFSARWDQSPLGMGAVGEAIRSGQPISFVASDQRCAAWAQFPAAEQVAAVAAFPFHLDDTLGVVAVFSVDPQAFTSDEIAYLHGATEYVATTLESERLRTMMFAERDRARRSEARLAALWSLALRNEPGLDAQAEAIISEGSLALGFEWGALGHVESEALIVDFVASLERRRRRLYPLDVTLARVAVNSGRTFASSDLTLDPRYALSAAVVENGLCAFAATPFAVGGRTYLLAFGSSHPLERPLGNDDLSYLDLLASFFTRALREREDEMRIRYLQSHDTLTGLLNRERFIERLDEMADRAGRYHERFAILTIDLDRFRQIIDEVAVVTPDEIIADLSRRLSRAMRSGQELFRVSGDSFAVIIPELGSPEQADMFARELLAAIEQPFHTSRAAFTVTASIGMAIYPDDGRDGTTLLNAATVALQRSKRGSVHQLHFFASDLDDRLSDRRQFIRDLHGAAERDEFILHYQPWMDLRTNGIVGVEALIRWNHPTRGLVMPDTFIPLAEESDAIFAIGDWVVRQAAHFSVQCRERGFPIVIAINLSARQFGDPELVPKIRETLGRAGVEPGALELEVTETFGVLDPHRASELLAELQRVGLRIALDDFGIGHSSLSLLKHLPVDIIKIDKAFVRGLPKETSDSAIARAILAIAESIACETRAEGIESPEQAQWLASSGCHTAQGFWIARPLAPKALLSWIEERNR